MSDTVAPSASKVMGTATVCPCTAGIALGRVSDGLSGRGVFVGEGVCVGRMVGVGVRVGVGVPVGLDVGRGA